MESSHSGLVRTLGKRVRGKPLQGFKSLTLRIFMTITMSPKEDWISPKAKLRNTSISGHGLFATDFIQAGEEVVRWGGIYVSGKEAQKAKQEGKHVMQFEDDLFSVEDRGESDSYFINHSCDPNLWMKDTFTLEAKRDIKPGEELTIDYVVFMADENYIAKWECGCGSVNCRHKITGKDWKIKELQDKYKNHFIPLINRRIEIANKGI